VTSGSHKDNFIGSRAASFKRPLFCVSVCVSATLMLNIWETKRLRFRGSRRIMGAYRKVLMRVD